MSRGHVQSKSASGEKAGSRAAARRPRPDLFGDSEGGLEQVEADIRDADSVAAAIDSADGVVNASVREEAIAELDLEQAAVLLARRREKLKDQGKWPPKKRR